MMKPSRLSSIFSPPHIHSDKFAYCQNPHRDMSSCIPLSHRCLLFWYQCRSPFLETHQIHNPTTPKRSYGQVVTCTSTVLGNVVILKTPFLSKSLGRVIQSDCAIVTLLCSNKSGFNEEMTAATKSITIKRWFLLNKRIVSMAMMVETAPHFWNLSV